MFHACDSRMHEAALFQRIFKFCTFLPKFSNILSFFTLFMPFFWKIACMPLLSRIGPGCAKFYWYSFPFTNGETSDDEKKMFCHLANSGTYSFNYRVTNSSSGIFKYKNLWTGPIIHDIRYFSYVKQHIT